MYVRDNQLFVSRFTFSNLPLGSPRNLPFDLPRKRARFDDRKENAVAFVFSNVPSTVRQVKVSGIVRVIVRGERPAFFLGRGMKRLDRFHRTRVEDEFLFQVKVFAHLDYLR